LGEDYMVPSNPTQPKSNTPNERVLNLRNFLGNDDSKMQKM